MRLVEGLALSRPRPSVATITRRAARAAAEHGWATPSYSTVHALVAGLDPQLLTLAHDGPAALWDRYELVYRRQPDRPNMIWQADHTELDLLVVDANATPGRPWLTVVLDDCSRGLRGSKVPPPDQKPAQVGGPYQSRSAGFKGRSYGLRTRVSYTLSHANNVGTSTADDGSNAA